MTGRNLFEGQPLPSEAGVGLAVPGSLAHLAEPLLNLDVFVADTANPTSVIADRDYHTVRAGPDGTLQSVLLVVKGERADPELLARLDEELALNRIESELVHARHPREQEDETGDPARRISAHPTRPPG